MAPNCSLLDSGVQTIQTIYILRLSWHSSVQEDAEAVANYEQGVFLII